MGIQKEAWEKVKLTSDTEIGPGILTIWTLFPALTK